jgi:DNA (cytosine-5)-methyltransferase 1
MCEAAQKRIDMLTHFSLFTGIGGIDIAAEKAGFTTVGQCEFADYPTKVLEKHWPAVPRWRDIRDVTKQSVEEKGIKDITLISGGFPCQPFSVAGKRRGKEDDRYLWPEMLRVISELQPTWVIGENVPGIVNMALEQCCIDLENQGYEVQPFNIPACAVDAPHRRARIFIVAWNANNFNERKVGGIQEWARTESCGICENVSDPNQIRCNMRGFEGQGIYREQSTCNEIDSSGQDVSNSFRFNGNDGRYGASEICRERSESPEISGSVSRSWPIEPELGRVANGIPNRVDRLKCLGNAVVPAQIYPLLQFIADIERSNQ